MKKTLIALVAFAMSLTATAGDYDQDKPFGFCTRSSRTDATQTFDVTGGGCYNYPIPASFAGKVAVLKSTGQDMRKVIEKTIENEENRVVIFDGSAGDFLVSANINITATDKTILGINNARICTQWHLTDEIIAALNKAGVPRMKTSKNTGGTLPNGQRVGEEAEYQTRRIIMEMTGDQQEMYRKAGTLSLRGCSNVIVRNLTFVGPGSIDVGGSDLLSCINSKHCWIDHCAFVDGQDGNFDITQSADFVTISWCTFSYTKRSYMHQNTNLVGYSNKEPRGFLNTTYAFNWWGEGCLQRMPMARVGKIHILNNYYSSTTANNCINPRDDSEFLVEGNYVEHGVRKYYSQSGAVGVTWRPDNYAADGKPLPESVGAEVTVPYDYTVAPSNDVPRVVKTHAGATLFVR